MMMIHISKMAFDVGTILLLMTYDSFSSRRRATHITTSPDLLFIIATSNIRYSTDITENKPAK